MSKKQTRRKARPAKQAEAPPVAAAMSELEVCLRARYPLIYIVSWEEERLLKQVAHTCKALGKDLYLWTVTEGLWRHSDPTQKDPARSSPLAVLNAACELKPQAKAVFALLDFHPYLEDPNVVRRLRDAARDLKASNKSILIISPVMIVPPELSKGMAVIDFDLPGAEELRAAFEAFLQTAQKTLNRQVDLTPGGIEKVVKAAQGLTLAEFENVLSKCAVVHSVLDLGMVSDIVAEKKQIIRKSGVLEYRSPDEELEQVGGLQNLKAWLRKRADAFSQRARDFGLPEPRGLLLVGVQGCGKSLTAKAIASAWRLPLLRLDVGRVFSSFVGSSEQNLREVVKTAESISPCILWIDEIEKGFCGSASSNYTDSGTTARVFGSFTTWLQEKSKPVFVVATANDVNQLPPELIRQGRFDEVFFVDLPGRQEREEILRIHLKKRHRTPSDFDVRRLGLETEGFSGAEIEQSIVSALYDAFESNRPLATTDIMRNISETVPLSRMMREQIDSLRQWALERARPANADDETRTL